MSLDISINGIGFDFPVMNAAGILGTTGASLRRMANSGAGGVVTKTISYNEEEGNKGPVLIETEYGVLNSMGLPNPGVNNYLEELKSIEDLEEPIICSIFAETPKKAGKVGQKLEEYVDAFELNLSCPNVEDEIICRNPLLIKSYLDEVTSSVDTPIWSKLSLSSNNILEASEIAEDYGSDSIVLINTIQGMLIDIESGRPILGNLTGGLSGKAIHPAAVKSIYEVSKKVDIPIIGVGGISDFESALEMIMAGASAVQIGTAIKENINIFKEIKSNLESYLDKKEIKDLEKLRGITHKF